jgi:hypothetical protein
VPDQAITDILQDQKLTPEQVETARHWKARAMGDPTSCSLFLQGNLQCMRQMLVADAILASAGPQLAPTEKRMSKRNEFDGLTNEDCCDDCNTERCVISEMPYCSHPRKGGLQSTSLRDPHAVRRYGRAKAYLRQQAARPRQGAWP